jgi:hypothetical protein
MESKTNCRYKCWLSTGFWVLGLFSGSLSLAAEESATKPMAHAQVKLFSGLYRIYPIPDFDIQPPVIQGKQPYVIKIMATNTADECDSENFSPTCKGTALYILVDDGDIGGKSYGMVTRRAYQWTVNKIEARSGGAPCQILHVAEKYVQSIDGRNTWATRNHQWCISPKGLM